MALPIILPLNRGFFMEHIMLKKINEKMRDYIKKRDSNRCRICNSQIHSGGHIHHLWHRNSVVPAYLNVPENSVHHPQNMVLLCPRCHTYYHLGKFPNGWRESAVKVNQELECVYEIPRDLMEIFKEKKVLK